MPKPVEQLIRSISGPDDVIRFAVSAQVSQLPEGTTDAWVAKALKISSQEFSRKLSPNSDRAFTDDELRRLDQIFVAAAGNRPPSALMHVGGTRSLAARVRPLDVNTTLADSPAEWTPDWLTDDTPPRTEFELLGQASALLAAFRTPSRASRDTLLRYNRPTRDIARRLIVLGGSPPTSRNIDALILLGGLANYAFPLITEILEYAIRTTPLGFRAWRAVSKLVRTKRPERDETTRALKAWVFELLTRAEPLRGTSLYPARSLDLEVAVNIPPDWSPEDEDWVEDVLYKRTQNPDASLRERGTAMHAIWQRAQHGSADKQRRVKDLLRRIIAERGADPPPEVAAGERWVATTLRHAIDSDSPGCDDLPTIDEDWHRAVHKALKGVERSSIPDHLKAGTTKLVEHALLQNAGAERRRAVDTLQTGGYVDPVTRVLASIVQDSDETWLRIRALFSLGFLKHPSLLVQQTLVDACVAAHERLVANPNPSTMNELHTALFAVGDCFGTSPDVAGEVRGLLEPLLRELVKEEAHNEEHALIARAAGYLLTVTAQPRAGATPDLSEELLTDLSHHPDSRTAQLSTWALGFRFADGRIRPLFHGA
ncbi:hypothetical protein RB614_17585 [Phytohabitans sp. ZYX-F-186]|uniref:HEAT repeat-containing protein n=1 Tax=Phytohabitans maris TaxID=3071409 RepID=A0ABU0ZGZ1_9ACTN|nr:hypothetical protein [Phytohabitans sp. ZYX-F-186]MDQ7906328.1 hypothetical protein [Phytohabitans sp. ZYX-F-186]